MATTVSQANQDKITQLNAKIKFVQNKLNVLKTTKADEVETENVAYKANLQTINTNYAVQISTLETEITTLQNQLEAVK